MVASDASMSEEGTKGEVYDMDESNEYIVVWNVVVMPGRRMGIFPFSLDCIGKTDLHMIHNMDAIHSPSERACKEYGIER